MDGESLSSATEELFLRFLKLAGTFKNADKVKCWEVLSWLKCWESVIPSTEEVTGIFVNSFIIVMKQTKMRAGSLGARRQLKGKGV